MLTLQFESQVDELVNAVLCHFLRSEHDHIISPNSTLRRLALLDEGWSMVANVNESSRVEEDTASIFHDSRSDSPSTYSLPSHAESIAPEGTTSATTMNLGDLNAGAASGAFLSIYTGAIADQSLLLDISGVSSESEQESWETIWSRSPPQAESTPHRVSGIYHV